MFPIIGIVLLLCFTIAPISPSVLLCFLMGAVLILVGMMFFTLGAEMSMTPMGERIGTCLTRSRNLPVIVAVAFLLGFIVTISEPDLQVLAGQVPAVPNMTLILSVACGVGAFLVIALLRMLFSMALPPLLVVCYAVVFVLAAFVPKDFLSVAFDSGGVTTGPMTVPFIMALGVGVSAIRSDRHAADDSFGLVALCSVGPILAVMILGMIYNPQNAAYTAPVIQEFGDSREMGLMFLLNFPLYMKEIAMALLPIFLFFMIFQIFLLKLAKRKVKKILVGFVYTYLGLVLFLTGANAGFMPAGNYLGQVLAGFRFTWILVPIAMVIGYFIVKAEPAVYVLNTLGVGVSAIRSDRHAADDSFGLVALCSVGPILAVMILGMIYNPQNAAYTAPVIQEFGDSREMGLMFLLNFPLYMKEIAMALLPIFLFFMIFQIFLLKLAKRKVKKILVGFVYTYLGLVLFLTGANAGFMPAGNYLGQVLAGFRFTWILVPIAMVIGYFIVKAEPAVYVLNKQVEEITDGAISAGAMGAGLSVGVAVSLGLAMIRVITGISILWFLIPGYAVALGISFFVPKIYTAIAFDSGGVASGPMTAAFLLPLAQGACTALGGNIVTDAFGVVAMVAMTPLITIQIMGLYARITERKQRKASAGTGVLAFDGIDDNAVIEL